MSLVKLRWSILFIKNQYQYRNGFIGDISKKATPMESIKNFE